ncbi:MAG: GNAT family N-acetyltransferase [Alphaproteobacteria bacterium]|nr:GNAT family N-acetyltransferase [Alphaproteobacteria bacterium]
MSIEIKVFKEKATAPYIHLLSKMRVEAFQEFPYLYVSGSIEDDLPYTQCYTLKHGLLIVAFLDQEVVGMYSAMPMTTKTEFLKAWSLTLEEAGINTKKCFYAGEVIVMTHMKRRGIGVALLRRLVEEVHAFGYETMMGVTSIRAHDHPLRPKGYFDSDAVWAAGGYKKLPLTFSCRYPTRQQDGSVKEEDNLLACWLMTIREVLETQKIAV